MKPPCEMVVWYIIPAIRSELAKDFMEKTKFAIKSIVEQLQRNKLI